MFRTSLAVALLTLFAIAGFAEDKKDKLPTNLYPLAKGTKWEYTAKTGGVEIDQVMEVTDVSEAKKGERAVVTLTVTSGTSKSAEKLSGDEKGVYRHETSRTKYDPPLQFLQYGVKAGTTWSRKQETLNGEITMEFEQKAAEKVTVPAGEFTAVPVVQTNKDTKGKAVSVMTTWYVEEVGVVKSAIDSPLFKYNMELKKHTPAK